MGWHIHGDSGCIQGGRDFGERDSGCSERDGSDSFRRRNGRYIHGGVCRDDSCEGCKACGGKGAGGIGSVPWPKAMLPGQL